jgi:hypothetical protein
MPMYSIPRSQSNQNITNQGINTQNKPSFLSKLFGTNRPKEVQIATTKNTTIEHNPNLSKSLLNKVKPSFTSNNFKFVSPQDDRFLIDGLPSDQAAYGVQLYGEFGKKETDLPDDYCDCDVCLKKESNPLPPKTPTPVPAIEGKKIEVNKDSSNKTNSSHHCCSCCCSRGNCNYRGSRRSRSRKNIRLVINVD